MLLTISLAALFATSSVYADAAAPVTISLSSRRLKPGLLKRAISPTNVPLDDFFLGTDLQWYGNISVGTPPQTISVVFDTGSTALEFASTRCDSSCNNQVRFDEKKSSTFVDTGRHNSITFGTGVGVDPVQGANYRLEMDSATETVGIGGLSAPKINVNLITQQTPAFAIDPFSGIQGMGATAGGIFGALVQKGLPSLFSLYLTPKSVGNAEMTVGGIDNSKFKGDIKYSPIVPFGSTWVLSSTAITVNGKSASALSTQRDIIFDSGTSNILLNTKTANALYALISPDIKPFAKERGTYGLPCNKVASLPAEISFTFPAQGGSTFSLTIPSSELSVGPFTQDKTVCQMLVNADDSINIIGGSLLKHYYSVWDIGGKRIGFAPI